MTVDRDLTGGDNMASTLGHELVLSETNTRNIVALCECGWIGIVHESHGLLAQAKHARKNAVEGARARAQDEHAKHLEHVRNEIATASHAALDAHAAYVERVRPTVGRIGRWGNG